MTATAGEQAGPVYLDSCVLLSLFLGDSGFDASETWLLSRDGTVTWTPETEPALMRASLPARIGQEKPHESQTP